MGVGDQAWHQQQRGGCRKPGDGSVPAGGGPAHQVDLPAEGDRRSEPGRRWCQRGRFRVGWSDQGGDRLMGQAQGHPAQWWVVGQVVSSRCRRQQVLLLAKDLLPGQLAQKPELFKKTDRNKNK